MMNKLLLASILLAYSLTIWSITPNEDVLLDVLKREVSFYYSKLSNDTIPVRYISLYVLDENNLTIDSEMGIASVNGDESRRLQPCIRFCTDSLPGLQKTRKSGWVYNLPFRNDTIVIKDIIWQALAREYDSANSILIPLCKRNRNDSVQKCEIPSKGEIYYETFLPRFKIDKDKWANMLNRVTSVKQNEVRGTCKANLSCVIQRKYMVDSEGTAIVHNSKMFLINLNAIVLDDNDNEVVLKKSFYAHNESELPDENVLRNTMNNLIERTVALSKAPMAEAYSGPVLFSGEAGGVFFHEVLGHRLEKADSEFKPMVGKNILPSDFSVICDPTIRSYKDMPLNGDYIYDDEGVAAQRVVCVADGLLKNMLTSRSLLNEGGVSNGHGRAEFGKTPMPRQSNLIIESSHLYTEQQLRDMFIQELKRCNKEYGYYIRTVSNGWTVKGDERRITSFNVTPVETYRIYADGRPDMLVRGVSFIGTPLSVFSNIKAAGGGYEVFNGKCGSGSGWIPVSCVSPMIYISQLETQRVRMSGSSGRLPLENVFKEAPCGLSEEDIIFKALSDEMQYSMDSLRKEDGSKPYFLDYAIRRTQTSRITSSLGACVNFSMGAIKNTGQASLLNGGRWDACYAPYMLPQVFDLTDKIDYNKIRGYLRSYTIDSFNRVPVSSELDNEQDSRASMTDSVPIWSDMPSNTIVEPSAFNNHQENMLVLKKMADTLSSVFLKYPELFCSSVEITVDNTDMYRLTSEGLHLRYPIKNISIIPSTRILLPNGRYDERREFFHFYNMEDLPPVDSLVAVIEKLASDLIEESHSPMFEEYYYTGPVICEGLQALSLFWDRDDNSKKSVSYYFASPRYNGSLSNFRDVYKKIGEQVFSKNVSVWQLGNDSVFNGRRLFRYQKYDADGVTPATIELIRNGILVNQLAGRVPSPKALVSTGNETFEERWNNAAPRITNYRRGVIRIFVDKTMNRRELLKRLIRFAKKQKKRYVFLLDTQKTIRFDTKTGEVQRVRMYASIDVPTVSKNEMMGSEENTVDGYASIIYPKTLLLPSMEMKLTPKKSYPILGKFFELRH